jgi:hypothetical protein
MARVACPSEAWDAHCVGQDDDDTACAFCGVPLPEAVEDTPAWDGWCSTVCGVLGGDYSHLSLLGAAYAAKRRDEARAALRTALDTRGPLSEAVEESMRAVVDAWEMARNVAVLLAQDQDVEPLLEFVPEAILFGACDPNRNALLHAILLAAGDTDTAFVPPAVAAMLEYAGLVSCDASQYQRKTRTRLAVRFKTAGRLLAGIRPCTEEGVCADCEGRGTHLRYSHEWADCHQCDSSGECPCANDSTLHGSLEMT